MRGNLPPNSGGPQWPKRAGSTPSSQSRGQFEKLQASLLYCPKCRQATPTREILLLILPEGELYDYRCAHCGTSTGSRTDKKSSDIRIYRG
ncbi:MAG TPA: hypothetical protein VFG95_02300 [Nitrospiria bacterium]|nr:hypothetical protein [Nitrospiria bacterium]